MKKFYFFAALFAGSVLTSCTSEDDLALSPPETDIEEGVSPIVFSSLKNNITRADITGKAAADSLGRKFVVSGFKGEKTATPGSMVFDNYLVVYGENTANTTESNTNNWEYVGKGLIAWADTNGITKQTIKYWDYSQPQYDFIAWSTGKAEAIFTGNYSKGKVLVSNITPNSKTDNPAWATGDPVRAAYSFSGFAEDLKDCYIADLVTVNKANEGGYGEVKKGYGQPVTLKFRQLGTKVRIGIYETVPGYSVRDVKFYKHGGLLTAETAGTATAPATLKEGQIVDSATIFTVASDIYKEGKYTVYFPTVDKPDSADNNQAHIQFTAAGDGSTSKTTIVNWGKLKYTYRESGEKSTEAIYLGRTSNTATFAGDSASNFYEFYLPNEKGTNLNLRVDFTLEAIDGVGEKIYVKNAKATVPSIYTTWKPGFAYTYLFKISDKTNGRTGVYDPTQTDDATINSDPAGLYPITFDAVVINAEEGNQTQETITLIATPSITTYQQYSTVVNANEYKATEKDIFVTVNDTANNVNDIVVLTNKAALYTIPSGMTEAEVIDALTYQDEDSLPGTTKGRSGMVLNKVTKVTGVNDLTTANTWMLTDSVKFGANGNAIKVGTDKALRFKPIANADTTYAFVYTKKTSTQDTITLYEALAWEKFATGQTKWRYDFKDAQSGDVKKDSVYFKEENSVYSKQTVFLGQKVDSLYADINGTTHASGYAKTGTAYYYTEDNGQNYKLAKNWDYKDAIKNVLYEKCPISDENPDGFKETTDDKPVNGKPYYNRTGTGTYVYTYCVFLPQQTTNLKVIDTNKYKKVEGESKIDGMTYFDKYTKNFDERYVKVIKIAK